MRCLNFCYYYHVAETIAVVPAYNSADLVYERVVQLKESSFASVFICDDKSGDDTVQQLSVHFNDSIIIIDGQDNIGPGGNRNRTLSSSDSPRQRQRIVYRLIFLLRGLKGLSLAPALAAWDLLPGVWYQLNLLQKF